MAFTKLKKVLLNSLTLQLHKLLTTLQSNEDVKLSKTPDYTKLTYSDIQTLLDTTPVPVFQDETEGYQLLTPMPFLHHLKKHPRFNKFEVTLINFIDPKRASHVFSTLNTLKLALSYPDSKRFPNVLAHRIQTATQAEIPVLSKKQLAHFAQLSPSAIRTTHK